MSKERNLLLGKKKGGGKLGQGAKMATKGTGAFGYQVGGGCPTDKLPGGSGKGKKPKGY